jgi:2'-5' RNA ligase
MNSHLLRSRVKSGADTSSSSNSTSSSSSTRKNTKKSHSYGCLLAPLPEMFAAILREWQEDYLRPQHLAPDGLEEEPHITIKYGFEGNHRAILEALLPILLRHGPIRARFTRLSVFPDSGDGVVLKLGVESRDLYELYHLLSASFACKDKHYPHYQPHSTLAYLDPAFGETYLLHRTPLDGQEILLSEVIYSTPEKARIRIPLQGNKVLSWINPLSGGALVEPPQTGSLQKKKPIEVNRNKGVFNTLASSLVSRKSFQSNCKVVPSRLTKNSMSQ